MRYGIRPALPVIAAAVLALSAAAQTPPASAPDTATPSAGGMSGMQGMSATGGMQPMMQQMMQQMQADDARLRDLVTKMNAATGQDKVDAMAAVVNEMASQQLALHQRMAVMMGSMTGGAGTSGMSGTGASGVSGMRSTQGMATGAASGGLIVTGVTSPYPPKVGENSFTFTVKDANGKPVAGASPRVAVAMAGMTMGTHHPKVEDLGGGRYRTKVNLTMAGRWQITVTTTPPGGAPVAKAFFVTAAGK